MLKILLLTLPILWIKIVGENGQINVNFWFPPWDLPSDLEIFGDSHMLHTKTEGDHLWFPTYPCWFWSVCQYFSWNLFLVNILDVDLLVYLVGNLFFREMEISPSLCDVISQVFFKNEWWNVWIWFNLPNFFGSNVIINIISQVKLLRCSRDLDLPWSRFVSLLLFIIMLLLLGPSIIYFLDSTLCYLGHFVIRI